MLITKGKSGKELALSFAIKLGIALVVSYLVRFHSMAGVVQHAVWNLGLYSLLGLFMDGFGVVAKPLLGLTLAPHFDKPYKALSVRELWSRRWNLVAGGALRFLVYDPIVEGACIKQRAARTHKPSRLHQLLAWQMVFVVSGLAHLFLLWWWTAVVDLRWLLFFVVQVPVLLVEQAYLALCRALGLRLPWPARWLLTMALVEVTQGPLFWPAVEELDLVGALARTFIQDHPQA